MLYLNTRTIIGNDLVIKMKISLSEALTGFSRTVTTLDNREIAITSIPGDFVKHEGEFHQSL